MNHLKEQLPERVYLALKAIAEEFEKQGAKLFVFGSFANRNAVSNSDLDIGVYWLNPKAKKLKSSIREAIANLPTIREIDFVPWDEMDEKLKKRVLEEGINLDNEKPIQDER